MIQQFQKKKDWLFCIDSDGCVMDTMDIKHIRIFGPCLVEQWELAEWKNEILQRWNEMNLYSMTRGINRFQGLAKMLNEINEMYCKIEGIHAFDAWVRESPQLSEKALREAATQTESVCMKKALGWSEQVNRQIDAMPDDEKRAFDGVKEALAYANHYGDVVIVSSANRQAVLDEWEKQGLLEHVDLILTQEAGTKAFCVGELLKKGYEKDMVLMIGDAPGDLEAAQKNGVFFYPVLVRHEKTSWDEFKTAAVGKLVSGTYGGEYAEKLKKRFINNLT